MKNILLQTDVIEGLLKPETDLERRILNDPDFRKGLFWGKPRYGHPEGKIIYHIAEVLKNIDQLRINSHTRQQLRLIAFIHDTFKNVEDHHRPRDWSRHHSVIARKFAERYTNDEIVLSIIEHHDEAFYSWRTIHVFQNPEKGIRRMNKLLENISNHIQPFYLFFKCDTQTGDKNQAPIKWFEETISEIEIVQF